MHATGFGPRQGTAARSRWWWGLHEQPGKRAQDEKKHILGMLWTDRSTFPTKPQRSPAVEFRLPSCSRRLRQSLPRGTAAAGVGRAPSVGDVLLPGAAKPRETVGSSRCLVNIVVARSEQSPFHLVAIHCPAGVGLLLAAIEFQIRAGLTRSISSRKTNGLRLWTVRLAISQLRQVRSRNGRLPRTPKSRYSGKHASSCPCRVAA